MLHVKHKVQCQSHAKFSLRVGKYDLPRVISHFADKQVFPLSKLWEHTI